MKPWSQNLTSKVASAFLLLSLISGGVVGGVAFFSAREALKQAAFNRLSVAATLKEEEISRWFEDQERDFLLTTQSPDVKRNLETLLDTKPTDWETRRLTPEYHQAHQVLSQYLQNVTTLKPNLREVFVVDRSNRIILSTDRTQEGRYEILANVTYLEAVEPGESFAPLFYVSPEQDRPVVTLAAPLDEETGTRHGVILAHLNLDRIDQIVRERTGLGDSGETYLVGSLVHKNTFISGEKTGGKTPSEEFPDGIDSQGINSAMQGISSSGLYQNYAGIPVIGVYRWLNDQDIALLVEMQQNEAFAPAQQLAATIVLVGSVAMSVLAIGVRWLTHQLQFSRQQLENYSYQLEKSAQAADAANRSKSEFLANMSHELRTPLNAILGFTQLLLRDSTTNVVQMEYLQIISRSGEHLLNLINDVLEMSKIESGRISLNPTDFDLFYLLSSLEEMFRLKAESVGLNLTVAQADIVPRYIRTDEGKLRQVLINLLDNAIKFTEAGQVILMVNAVDPGLPIEPALSFVQGEAILPQVESLMSSGHSDLSSPLQLWFTVSDTGCGIAANELKTLFEPFVQSESGLKSQQGTGLGLPISQQFVRLMGGEIAVTSVVGQGTTFQFNIAIELVDAVTAVPRLDRQVVGLEPDQPQYRILVVEDKWENRQLLVKILTTIGFDVREAENGQIGYNIWQEWEPHLIWMDMRMPVMDGYEATQQIRSHPKGQATAIIALTASAFEETRSAILAAGCDDFVRKPFQQSVLLDKMAEHLGVRYLYVQATDSPEEETQNGKLRPAKPIKSADLAAMPIEWICQLKQAATRVDAADIHVLIQTIPATHADLAVALTDLTNNYCFEEILSLTESIAEN